MRLIFDENRERHHIVRSVTAETEFDDVKFILTALCGETQRTHELDFFEKSMLPACRGCAERWPSG